MAQASRGIKVSPAHVLLGLGSLLIVAASLLIKYRGEPAPNSKHASYAFLGGARLIGSLTNERFSEGGFDNYPLIDVYEISGPPSQILQRATEELTGTESRRATITWVFEPHKIMETTLFRTPWKGFHAPTVLLIANARELLPSRELRFTPDITTIEVSGPDTLNASARSR